MIDEEINRSFPSTRILTFGDAGCAHHLMITNGGAADLIRSGQEPTALVGID